MKKFKFIFVTGGVVSSIGKGITVASVGRLLKSRGVSVSVLKLDPYLNVDPGTMSPYQHGEVFVTKDGSETDLDLGHYERFIDIELTSSSNCTAGEIFSDVISRERKGEFLGGTIQVDPHVTEAIKQRIYKVAQESRASVVVVEVGGTVGDIEGQPFIEAIRQIKNEVDINSTYYIHVTYLPYMKMTGELKTKPTQHSVRELRGMGIQPDAIVCRSDYPLDDDTKLKISRYCDVRSNSVIELENASSVYEVPLHLENQNFSKIISQSLDLKHKRLNMIQWKKMLSIIQNIPDTIRIAVVGKYVDLPDSYISVKESLTHAGFKYNLGIEVIWIRAEDIEKNGPAEFLGNVDGVVIPGGFGPRGIEGMIDTVTYCRENEIPCLGLCLGLQVMVIEAARNLLNLDSANSMEFDLNTNHPVIHLMDDQKEVDQKGGTMRLGVYPCSIVKDTLASASYQRDLIEERHRHRFEVNNYYLSKFREQGFLASGVSPNGKLVEIMELKEHPFMLGVQFHPEFLSRPESPHPLFVEFIKTSSQTLREGKQYPLI